MRFSLKSTSFKSKTSEQMEIRYILKLCPKTATRPNRNRSATYFLKSLIVTLST
jgi:hypothetical protein